MIIRRDAFRAVLPATSTDSPQFALIQINPDGRLAATDGHVCFVATDKYPQDDTEFPSKNVPPFTGNPTTPIVIDRGVAEQLVAATPKKSPVPILMSVQLSTNGDGVTLAATDLQSPRVTHVSADEAGRKFPAWERVMPAKDKPALSVCLSVPVLEAILKAAKGIQNTRSPLRTVTFRLPTEPQYQGRKPSGEGDDNIAKQRTTEPDGMVISAIRVEIAGDDVSVEAAVMPCRI